MFEMSMVRVVGFDLDQTLYPKSPLIDEAIQKYIYGKISEFKGCNVEKAKELFCAYYPGISGRQTLVQLGIPNADGVIQEALDNADIAQFLVPNQKTISLLKRIKEKFGLVSLITGSSETLLYKKLASLSIPADVFVVCVGGDFKKSDGSAFRRWFEVCKVHNASLVPANFLYVGDRKSTDADVPLSLGMQAVLVNVASPDPTLDIPQLSSLFDLEPLLLF